MEKSLLAALNPNAKDPLANLLKTPVSRRRTLAMLGAGALTISAGIELSACGGSALPQKAEQPPVDPTFEALIEKRNALEKELGSDARVIASKIVGLGKQHLETSRRTDAIQNVTVPVADGSYAFSIRATAFNEDGSVPKDATIYEVSAGVYRGKDLDVHETYHLDFQDGGSGVISQIDETFWTQLDDAGYPKVISYTTMTPDAFPQGAIQQYNDKFLTLIGDAEQLKSVPQAF